MAGYEVIMTIPDYIEKINKLEQDREEIIKFLEHEVKNGRPPEYDEYGNTLLWDIGYFDACKEILYRINKRKKK